jgi:hypothetical protein
VNSAEKIEKERKDQEKSRTLPRVSTSRVKCTGATADQLNPELLPEGKDCPAKRPPSERFIEQRSVQRSKQHSTQSNNWQSPCSQAAKAELR